MINMEEFKQDVTIDKFNLDEEVVYQVDKFVTWAEEHIMAIDARDRAKAKIDLVKATLDQSIRTDPGKYGIEKVTEKSVESAMIRSDLYQEAIEEHLEAKKQAEFGAMAREAMMQRKSMLNSLVTLNMMAYYGDPDFKDETIRKEIRRKD